MRAKMNIHQAEMKCWLDQRLEEIMASCQNFDIVNKIDWLPAREIIMRGQKLKKKLTQPCAAQPSL